MCPTHSIYIHTTSITGVPEYGTMDKVQKPSNPEKFSYFEKNKSIRKEIFGDERINIYVIRAVNCESVL
jgi:hypothetical protein